MISSFTGVHRFLSNFWPSEVALDGIVYASVEHAYQAAKTTDPDERRLIGRCERAGQAKRMGRRVTMRDDWESVKVGIMEALLRQKFFPGSELAFRLISTAGEELVEGNTWGDRVWGQCPVGTGHNLLGLLLMTIRQDLLR